MTPRTNITLQGKGGVGKSFCASTLAQWLHSTGRKPVCIDTDPVNRTFSGYAALRVEHIKIMQDDEINSRRFDELVERISGTDEDVVIDNGSSSFVALSHYLLSNDVPAVLSSLGHPLVVHVVITGGQMLVDTMNGFAHVVQHFGDDASFVVWLNPFWGPIVHEGKSFEEMRAYTAVRDRVSAIIQVPRLKAETFGADLSSVLKARQTFAEAIAAPERSIMERQRIKVIKDRLFEQLRTAAL